MTAIATALGRLTLGPAQTFQNLTVFPLCREGSRSRPYLTLDEALIDNGVRITEVSEHGDVPELRLTNDLKQPVLLVDGEELVGAKQNRVLNLSVLAPPQTTIKIPVSCVERGRWQWQHRHFHAADRTQYAAGRAARVAMVSRSLARSGTRASDQHAVWADLDAKSMRMSVASDTSAMSALYESTHATLEQYVSAFRPAGSQVGAVFAIHGKVTGLELFDHTDTLKRLLPKIVRAHAIDAIERPGRGASGGEPHAAETFLHTVSTASARTFPGVGLGTDVRLEGAGVVGAALVADEAVLHLLAFPTRASV